MWCVTVSQSLTDAKADPAKSEATVGSPFTAAKKAVQRDSSEPALIGLAAVPSLDADVHGLVLRALFTY
jgi:hypothetical protein